MPPCLHTKRKHARESLLVRKVHTLGVFVFVCDIANVLRSQPQTERICIVRCCCGERSIEGCVSVHKYRIWVVPNG